MKPRLVVLSGAGISAESGIQTFRDANGLWEGYDVHEVASPEGWDKNPELVLDFYNQRRRQAATSKPNRGHLVLAELETLFDVTIITQNVDNLHEKAGSNTIIHLHGELFKSQSTTNPELIYKIDGTELNIGDTDELGNQLRPFIVWFGEQVPLLEEAIKHVALADIVIVVGTSLNVYPAAQLVEYIQDKTDVYVIDPHIPYVDPKENLFLIEEKGTFGLQQLKEVLINQYS